MEWSSSEDKIVYVAEKKQPKKVSYFDPKSNSKKDDKESADKEPTLQVFLDNYDT